MADRFYDDDYYYDDFAPLPSAKQTASMLPYILLFACLLCCCSSSMAWAIRKKCKLKGTWTNYVNDNWWMWLVGILFPQVLVLKIVLLLTCN
jgi:hypothetical protein